MITDSTVSDNVARPRWRHRHGHPLKLHDDHEQHANWEPSRWRWRGHRRGDPCSATLTNSTVSGNAAESVAVPAALAAFDPLDILGARNTILAHNSVTPTGTGPDCHAPFISGRP